MTKEALIEKIESLPPEKRAEVEDFVDFVAGRVPSHASTSTRKTFPNELLKRIDERRERLFREHGLFPDSTKVIRELRERGE